MFRLLLSISLSVVIARWAYQEVELCVPQLVPYIDYSLERVQIPTHDKWLKTALTNALLVINEDLPEMREAAPSRSAAKRRELNRETPPQPTGGFSTVAYSRNSAFDRF